MHPIPPTSPLPGSITIVIPLLLLLIFSSPLLSSSLLSFFLLCHAAIFLPEQSLPFFEQIGFVLPLAWLFESVWAFAFNYEVIWLSLLFIYAALVSLFLSWYRLHAGTSLSLAKQILFQSYQGK